MNQDPSNIEKLGQVSSISISISNSKLQNNFPSFLKDNINFIENCESLSDFYIDISNNEIGDESLDLLLKTIQHLLQDKEIKKMAFLLNGNSLTSNISDHISRMMNSLAESGCSNITIGLSENDLEKKGTALIIETADRIRKKINIQKIQRNLNENFDSVQLEEQITLFFDESQVDCSLVDLVSQNLTKKESCLNIVIS